MLKIKMDKSIEELDTENTKIVHNTYSVGDYIHYYKMHNDTIITTNGEIIKNILNNLYIVNNFDTKMYEKITIYNIINKFDEIDTMNQSLSPTSSFNI
jgi:hypothetical protein